MEYVILDLEWNGTYSKKLKGFFNEIIEFGAVKVDRELNIVETFSMLVRPQIGKKLSGKVKKLTNISNEDLGEGVPFTKALSRFKKFLGGAVLMTWGTSDILALIENNKYFTNQNKLDFIRYYLDLQVYCERRLLYKKGQQMGLSTAAELLSIDQEGVEHHRALDDSLLSLECLRRLYQEEALVELVQNAMCDVFYDKMCFKTTILCDLRNPLIDENEMYFDCDACGKRACRTTDWEMKNKSFRAVFHCAGCEKDFIGRIQFKLKYEGLLIKKRLIPIKKAEDSEQEAEELRVETSGGH